MNPVINRMEIDSSEVDTFQVTKEARVVMTKYFKNVKKYCRKSLCPA